MWVIFKNIGMTKRIFLFIVLCFLFFSFLSLWPRDSSMHFYTWSQLEEPRFCDRNSDQVPGDESSGDTISKHKCKTITASHQHKDNRRDWLLSLPFLLIPQSGAGWKTFQCMKEGNIKINQNAATLLLGALQALINHGQGRMSSLSIYCEWTNGILFLSSWKQLWLKVHSACSEVPHFPSLLFRDCESWGQFAFTVNFQRLTSNLSANSFLTIVLFYSAEPPWWVYCLCLLALWQFTSTGAPNTVNWHNTLSQSK